MLASDAMGDKDEYSRPFVQQLIGAVVGRRRPHNIPYPLHRICFILGTRESLKNRRITNQPMNPTPRLAASAG